jgi:class 3 adenylate cyclase
VKGTSAPLVVAFAIIKPASERLDQSIEEQWVATLGGMITDGGGKLVKSLTNGVMAVFTSPADAISCALAMRRAIQEEAALTLQAGLSFGEPLVEGDDYFGTPVVIARRLCDRAEPGQVLCASLIARLESARERATFRSCGSLQLKGIDVPVSASEVLEREHREEAQAPS